MCILRVLCVWEVGGGSVRRWQKSGSGVSYVPGFQDQAGHPLLASRLVNKGLRTYFLVTTIDMESGTWVHSSRSSVNVFEAQQAAALHGVVAHVHHIWSSVQGYRTHKARVI